MSIIQFLKTLSIFKQLRFENVFQNTFCYPWTMVYVWMLFGYYLIFYMANDKILTYICLFRNIFVKCLMYNTIHEHSIVDSIIIIKLRNLYYHFFRITSLQLFTIIMTKVIEVVKTPS